MSNAILFLEALGREPAAAGYSDSGYAAAVAALELEEPQRRALIGRDRDALARLLEGRATMVCAICTPDDASEQQIVPDDGDSGDEKVPDQEPVPERE